MKFCKSPIKNLHVFSISMFSKAQDDSLQRHLCRRGAHRGPLGDAHFDGLRGGTAVGAGRDTGDDRGLTGPWLLAMVFTIKTWWISWSSGMIHLIEKSGCKVGFD